VHHRNPSVDRPVRELKGFDKVHLEPGASARVTIELDASAFSYFHPEEFRWVMESGTYEIQIGNSSRDIHLAAVIAL